MSDNFYVEKISSPPLTVRAAMVFLTCNTWYFDNEAEAKLAAIKGELKYWRFGGREGQEQLDLSNLGFVDHSGGPFLQLGMSIEGRKIKNISANGDLDGQPEILFEVEHE